MEVQLAKSTTRVRDCTSVPMFAESMSAITFFSTLAAEEWETSWTWELPRISRRRVVSAWPVWELSCDGKCTRAMMGEAAAVGGAAVVAVSDPVGRRVDVLSASMKPVGVIAACRAAGWSQQVGDSNWMWLGDSNWM